MSNTINTHMIHSYTLPSSKMIQLCNCRCLSSALAVFMNGCYIMDYRYIKSFKDEAIQFSLRRGHSSVDDMQCVNVSGVDIQPAATVKSLGVVLDCSLSFNQQVSNVCRACYDHIRALRHIRDSFPNDVARTVACCIVSS